MKTLRLLVVLLTAAALGGCILVGGGGVTLTAEKVSLLSGEITSLSADVWPNDGSLVDYQWTEDGVALDATDSSLSYSRFVTAPVTVTIEVTAHPAGGGMSSSSRTLYITPPAFPATLVVTNDSPFPVYYLHVSATGDSSWGPDQMRPSTTIPPSGSFVLQGVPAGSWDVMAVGNGGSPVWTRTLSFNQGEVKALHLY